MESAASDTLQRFYRAFADLDAAAMGACYAPQASFEDPVFSLSGGAEIAAMWGMLVAAVEAQGRDVWHLEFSVTPSTGSDAAAHWQARYRFSATGRLVHNQIDARVCCDSEGLILRHTDDFDFWRWSRQALGASGWLLGWTPWLRGQVRRQARASLARYRQRQG